VGGTGKRPVMVWFHGGGYSGGSGGNVRYDGRRLAERQDVVIVTVNHRLNAFGFLYLGDLGGSAYAQSGNVGLLDLIAALQWVRTNIAQFGGDPDNVTIFGQSGGGGKVTSLMAMPMAKGLFHKAIAQSGLALRARTTEQASQTTRALMSRAGLRPDQVAELQALPADRIVAAMAAARPGELNFGPVLDHQTLMHDPFESGAPQESATVPLLLGSTLTETTFFADTPLDPIDEPGLRRFVASNTRLGEVDVDPLIAVYRKGYPDASNTRLAQLISTDNWLTVDMARVAAGKTALGPAPAFLYHFEKTTPVRGGVLGAPHTIEIPYVFDNVEMANSQILVGSPSQSQALASQVSATWASFARTGRPQVPGGPVWRAYSEQDRAVMVINDQWRMAVDPHAEQRLAMAEVKAKTHYNGRG
jgi:para-nitrobenzyl esterase